MNALEYIELAAVNPQQASKLADQLTTLAREHAELGAFTFVAAQSKPPTGQQPLRGLPLIVKDNIDVAGMPTTAGSKALGSIVPSRHCSVIQTLTDAGAHILGKANLHEFSLGITSNNGTFGPARNPYDLSRIPGGSSGGNAAAVAAGFAIASIGSDTGGSLRVPAALCGVVGFRPTTGRWPSDGVVTISHTRDTLGPIAKTVADCALLDAIVCDEPTELNAVALNGLRLGVPRQLFWRDLDPSVSQACEAFLKRLADFGVTLVEVDLAINHQDCTHAGMVIALVELFPNIAAYLKQHGKPFDANAICKAVGSPDVKGIMQSLLGPDAPPQAAYEKALHQARPLFQKAYADCFRDHQLDAIIFPTTALPAAPIGDDETVMLNGQAVPTFMTFARNLAPGSLVGVPGICLPIGCNAQGLPLSIALEGPASKDRQLLAIALAIEALLPPMPQPKFHRNNF